MACAAIALYVGVVRDLPAYTGGWQIPWWALALAFAATEVFVIHAHIRGSAQTLSLSEIPLVIGLLLATPQDLVLAQILGPLVVLLFTRGTAPVKIAFNVAQFALTATLSVAVLHAVMPAPAEIGPGVWSATFIAVGAGSLVAGALVVTVIALAEGALPSGEMLRMFGADLVVSLTNTSIGLVGATLMAQSWSAGWLIIPPAAVLILAYRAYLQRAHEASVAGLPLRRRAVAQPRARHRERAGRPAAADARGVPGAERGDHPVRRRGRRAAADLAGRRRRHAVDAVGAARARDRAARLPRRRARDRGARGSARRPRWPSTSSSTG